MWLNGSARGTTETFKAAPVACLTYMHRNLDTGVSHLPKQKVSRSNKLLDMGKTIKMPTPTSRTAQRTYLKQYHHPVMTLKRLWRQSIENCQVSTAGYLQWKSCIKSSKLFESLQFSQQQEFLFVTEIKALLEVCCEKTH